MVKYANFCRLLEEAKVRLGGLVAELVFPVSIMQILVGTKIGGEALFWGKG